MTSVTTTGSSPGVFDVWLSNQHWTGPTLTYSFPTDGSTYSNMNTEDVTRLEISQKVVVRNILNEIAGFTGLNFVEVLEKPHSIGDLRFATDVLDSGAYAYLPSWDEEGGDAFFGPSTANPQIGNEAYLYFTHEIGHTMGLDHGHEYPSFKNGPYNSQEFTVVTYTDYVGDPDTFTFDSGVVDWAQSYMQLDIAAMQFLYGGNYATSGEVWSGDTVYTFNPLTGEMTINGVGQGTPAGNRIFRTIWDGDGDDTYDLNGYTTDLKINLGPGRWSTFSTNQLADLNRHSADTKYDARGNVANALLMDDDIRGLIENAIGGVGDDIIRGNQIDNTLEGGGGSDRLLGLAGQDNLKGGNGADILLGGKHMDWLRGENGRDTLKGGDGRDRLLGGKNNDELFGNKGNDILTGHGGKDILTGGLGRDVFRFKNASDSQVGRADIVKDFVSGVDVLDLSAMSDTRFVLWLGGHFTGEGPRVITKTVGDKTIILADVDGDTTTDFRLILEGTSTISVGDFWL